MNTLRELAPALLKSSDGQLFLWWYAADGRRDGQCVLQVLEESGSVAVLVYRRIDLSGDDPATSMIGGRLGWPFMAVVKSPRLLIEGPIEKRFLQ